MPIDAVQSLRHNFAIWVLGRRPGFFKPQRYTYRCLRCQWTFIVNDERRGSIRVAFDRSGLLTASEAARRLATFEMGPCPGLRVLASQVLETPSTNFRARSRRSQNESAYVASSDVPAGAGRFGPLLRILTRLRGDLRRSA
jgi:hypothetical protein